MKINLIKIISSVFSFLIYFIGGLFVISVISNLIEYSSLSFSLKGEAISNMLMVYSTSIKIGTAFFASLAIWLTIQRMKQTDNQIDELIKNNRFNNFLYIVRNSKRSS